LQNSLFEWIEYGVRSEKQNLIEKDNTKKKKKKKKKLKKKAKELTKYMIFTQTRYKKIHEVKFE